MIIRLIPRVCDGLKDPSKCKELLQYCNGNDSHEVCNVKLITHAVLNPENINDAQHLGKVIYRTGSNAIDYVQRAVISDIAEVEGKTRIWYEHSNEPLVKVVAHGIETVGLIVSDFF
jgi:hypothetical protein